MACDGTKAESFDPENYSDQTSVKLIFRLFSWSGFRPEYRVHAEPLRIVVTIAGFPSFFDVKKNEKDDYNKDTHCC